MILKAVIVSTAGVRSHLFFVTHGRIYPISFLIKSKYLKYLFSTTYIKNEKFRDTLILDTDGIRNFIHPDF